MATVNGTAGNDFIHVAGDGLTAPAGYTDNPAATDGADTINSGNGGSDIIHAGAGEDTINFGSDIDSTDQIDGGAGADVLEGGKGSDTITPGSGNDVVVYLNALESTGTNVDTIDGFSFGSDTFNIPGAAGTITAIDPAVSGALSSATFTSDLGSALLNKLGADHAVLFTATSGTLSGQHYLVVDLNDHHGYQSGLDLVIHLVGQTGTLVTGDFI